MTPSTIRRATCGLAVLLALPACGAQRVPDVAAPAAAPSPQGARPTLLVLLTVDQMRPDYYDRYRGDLRDGLVRLFEGGAVFTNAHHDHAITETAPGHATLWSGRFPRNTGITRNILGVNGGEWPLLVGRGPTASPFRFRGTTLFDWVAAAYPGARALSVSAKDRAAILPIGRSKQEVYWFTDDGFFTSSTWYRAEMPAWARSFNDRQLARGFAGREWNTLPGVRYPEPDSVVAEGFGRNFTFPHRFSQDSNAVPLQVRYSPMVDSLTAQFAWQGFRALDIGRGPGIDVLAVSFSATDYVGHSYGPESREQHDNVVRLDRVLGRFLDSLFSVRDSSRILIALSADHGVQKIPELHGGYRVTMRTATAAARALVRARGGDTTAVDFESGGFFVEPAALAGGLTEGEVTDAFMRAARAIPGVQRVERWGDLMRRDPRRDPVARRWSQMMPKEMVPTAIVVLQRGSIYNGNVATHGSPHDEDSHVPIVFWGASVARGRHGRFVRTIDIAPTVAWALGVRPGEALDGVVLPEVFRR